MEDTIINSLISQAPGVAGVIIVVVLFLRAQEKQNSDWRAFLREQREQQAQEFGRVITMLTTLNENCGQVGDNLRDMRTYLETRIDAMQKAQNSRRKSDLKVAK